MRGEHDHRRHQRGVERHGHADDGVVNPAPGRYANRRRKRRDAVVCGDWNIGHTENDIKAWKANQKKAGFLPAERQWLTDLLATGWVDVVRVIHPGVAGPYSWWSWRGKAFDNDAGWRIDYQLANRRLAEPGWQRARFQPDHQHWP